VLREGSLEARITVRIFEVTSMYVTPGHKEKDFQERLHSFLWHLIEGAITLRTKANFQGSKELELNPS
jgi:hypothetical protein